MRGGSRRICCRRPAPITRSGSTARRCDGRSEEPVDPLYGERYLPRKFKIGLAIPEDNTIDVLTNDLAIVALFEAGERRWLGYNFLLGGGHGMTHNKPETYPRLATPVAFVEPDDLLEAARGGRAAAPRLGRPRQPPPCASQIRHRRARRGLGARASVRGSRQDAGAVPRRCRPSACPTISAGTSRATAGSISALPIPSGRIADDEHAPAAHGAARDRRAISAVDPILMPTQDIILSDDFDPPTATRSTALLRDMACASPRTCLPVERWALACPALPSCGLALTEAERVRDDIVGAIAARLRRWGLEGERLSIRITGCPNGCARPYSGDIGIVGRVPGFYSLYVGGDFEGTRLNQPLADRLDIAGIADALDPLFGLVRRASGWRTKASAISATASASPPCASRSRRPPHPIRLTDRSFRASTVTWSSVGLPGAAPPRRRVRERRGQRSASHSAASPPMSWPDRADNNRQYPPACPARRSARH